MYFPDVCWALFIWFEWDHTVVANRVDALGGGAETERKRRPIGMWGQTEVFFIIFGGAYSLIPEIRVNIDSLAGCIFISHKKIIQIVINGHVNIDKVMVMVDIGIAGMLCHVDIANAFTNVVVLVNRSPTLTILIFILYFYRYIK